MITNPVMGRLAASDTADRMREAVKQLVAAETEGQWHQTLSIGISVFPYAASTPDALVREAVRAARRARDFGGDRVEHAVDAGWQSTD